MKAPSLNLVDRCTLAYNGVVLAVVFVFHATIPHWPLQILLNASVIALVMLLALVAGERKALVPRLARDLAPLVLFLPLYGQIGSINHIVFPEFLDPLFCRIEEGVFGCQPAVVLAQKFPQRWVAEYMHFAYASYYMLFTGLAGFLILRRERAAFCDYMFSLCATMYVCLLVQILLPVKGAVSFGFGDAPGSASLPFTAAMAWVYRHLEIEGGAFPSSHVAVAALVLFYTVRYVRSAAWVAGPLVISLIVSTVYCRYHYAIDAVAGLATTALLLPVWRRINPALHPPSRSYQRLTSRTP